MLYETLDDIPRDCEVPYEREWEEENASSHPNTKEPSTYILPEPNLKDLIDWD